MAGSHATSDYPPTLPVLVIEVADGAVVMAVDDRVEDAVVVEVDTDAGEVSIAEAQS